MLVDPKVYDLAKAFINDIQISPQNAKVDKGIYIQELAEDIQRTIENFCSGLTTDEDE